jgi:hypothetical protein
MLIIGASGKKRHGKDSLFETIASASNQRVHRFAFADALKKEVCAACGVTLEELNANKELYRHLLQAWGTWRREHDGPEYWVKQLDNKLKSPWARTNVDIAVITDVRYPNEAELVKARGGIMVRVNRPNLTSLDLNADMHMSETALDSWNFDYVIQNNGTLDEFQSKVADLLDGIMYSKEVARAAA